MAERLFTWVAPIPRGALETVKAALHDIDKDPARNDWLPFGQLPMLHFASMTLFEGADAGQPATLVFESNIDRPVKTYVARLVEIGRAGLNRIYGACDRYPPPDAPSSAVIEFLTKHKRRPQLYHIGHPDRCVQE